MAQAMKMVQDKAWKRWKAVKLEDPSEAARVVYEVDTAKADKFECFQILEKLLHRLTDMPAALEECQIAMSTLKETGAGTDWKAVAAAKRDHQKRGLADDIKRLKMQREEAGKNMRALKAAPLIPIDFEDEPVVMMEADDLAAGKDPPADKQAAKKKAIAEAAQMAFLDGELRYYDKEIRARDEEYMKLTVKEKNGTWDKDDEHEAKKDMNFATSTQKPAVDTWIIAKRRIMRTILQAANDTLAEGELTSICTARLESKQMTDGQLQFAQDLQDEQRMFSWALTLYDSPPQVAEKLMSNQGYTAWMMFKNAIPNKGQWTYLEQTRTNSAKIMSTVIAKLREMKDPWRQETPVNAVAKSRGKQAEKVVRSTKKEGHYSELTQDLEPLDAEDEPKPAKAKKAKSKEDSEDDAGAPAPVALVRKETLSEGMLVEALKLVTAELLAKISKSTDQGTKIMQDLATEVRIHTKPQAEAPVPAQSRNDDWQPKGGRGGRGRGNYNRQYNPRYDSNKSGNGRGDYQDHDSKRDNKRRHDDDDQQRKQGNRSPPVHAQRSGNIQDTSVNAVTGDRRICKFEKCQSSRCQFAHVAGQHQPDDALMERAGNFKKTNRCKWHHDDENCTNRTCTRMHGKSTQAGPRCENADKMCENFYNGGCAKNHKK